MPVRVSWISLPTMAVRVDEPTVSIPSHRARRTVLPMIAASTPPVQMPPSFVPQPGVRYFAAVQQPSRDGSRMSVTTLSSTRPWRSAAGRPCSCCWRMIPKARKPRTRVRITLVSRDLWGPSATNPASAVPPPWITESWTETFACAPQVLTPSVRTRVMRRPWRRTSLEPSKTATAIPPSLLSGAGPAAVRGGRASPGPAGRDRPLPRCAPPQQAADPRDRRAAHAGRPRDLAASPEDLPGDGEDRRRGGVRSARESRCSIGRAAARDDRRPPDDPRDASARGENDPGRDGVASRARGELVRRRDREHHQRLGDRRDGSRRGAEGARGRDELPQPAAAHRPPAAEPRPRDAAPRAGATRRQAGGAGGGRARLDPRATDGPQRERRQRGDRAGARRGRAA